VNLAETNASSLNMRVKDAGAYRLEAWLDVDGEARPWITRTRSISKKPSLATLAAARLPSGETPPTVAVTKGIVYAEGKPEDEAKHKLDLYLPKEKTNAPGFCLHSRRCLAIRGPRALPGVRQSVRRARHRGRGDELPLGAEEPASAQIEDVADAFAWVAHHIKRIRWRHQPHLPGRAFGGRASGRAARTE